MFDLSAVVLLLVHVAVAFPVVYYKLLPVWLLVIIMVITRTSLAGVGHYHCHREERDHRLGRGVVRHSVRWCFRDSERRACDVAPHLHRNSCGREANRFQLHAHAASYRSHSHFYFAEVLRVFQWPLAQILRFSETPRGTKQQIEGVPVHLSSLVHGRRNVLGVLLWSSSDVVLAVLLHCVVEHVSDRGPPRLRVGEGKP